MASPGWSNAIRVCFSDSDEEVFIEGKEDSTWRPLGTNRLPDENLKSPALPTLDERNETTYFESHAVQHQDYLSSSEENVSPFEDLRNRSDSTSNAAASAKTDSQVPYCAESESSQRVGSLSDYDHGYAAESAEMQMQQQPYSQSHMHKLERKRSIVDGLLLEIYDRGHRHRADSLDSDTFTECSSASEAPFIRWDGHYDPGLAALQQQQQQPAKRYYRHCLQSYSREDLHRLTQDLQRSVTQMSLRLVRQLKRRDRRVARLSRHCDVVTAVLQAASLKRQIDTRMKFSLAPPPGPSAFQQWKDAMIAVNRLPMGIPAEFRKKVWLSLADHYIRQLKIDWQHTVRLAFNDRSNPDDDKLGLQIVKDLHRTGCSSFSGQDNEEDRAVLKRVLLAYARWNKRIGYCQGFNVIVALLLDVTERKEDDALKVMIYLIDHVLPESYFDNNLRALSVDMAVFRDLLRLTLPTLSTRLDSLQHAAQDLNTGSCYEPPLTNVFTMQWFLTLFATCLPKDVVLRVWDAILLEGSEVLLRTALCLWGKLARRIMAVDSADEFYSLMGDLSSDMMEGVVYDSDGIIKAIYAVAPFPFPQLTELREKYTYNIRPFSTAATPAPSRKLSRLAKAVLYSDEEEPDEEELRAMAAFPGMTPSPGTKGKSTDISVVGPGVFGAEPEAVTGISRDTVYMERMSTDITALKMQYNKLRFRQRQAHVINAAVSARKAVEVKQKSQAPVLVPKMDTPLAINHLFVGKVQGRNRLVTKGPCMAAIPTARNNSAATRQVQAHTTAHPVSWETYPTARHSPPSSSPARETGESKQLLQGGLEEPLQIYSKAKELRRMSSSSEYADYDTVSKSSISEAGCLVADARSDDQNGGHEKQYHLPPSSDPENHTMDSECLKHGAESKSSNPPASPNEVAANGTDNGENQPVQQTQFSGSSDRLSRQREVEDKAVLSSEHGTDSNVHSDHLHCRNCEVAEGKSAVVPFVPKNQQQARSEWGVNAVCAESFPTKTHGARDKACGEDKGLRHSHMVISRALSLPTPSTTTNSKKPLFSPSTTPVHKAPLSSVDGAAGVKARHLSSPSSVKSPRPFNPFPVKHINSNRARTGVRLGLYTPSTLEHIQGQLVGGLVLKKASHASS